MAGDTEVQTNQGKERRRDLGGGVTAPVAVAVDGDGRVNSPSSPTIVDNHAWEPYNRLLINTLYGGNMARDFTVGLTPLKIYNAEDSLWTVNEITGATLAEPATAPVTAPSPPNAAKWDGPETGDIIEFDNVSSQSLATYDQFTFGVYVESNWTTDSVQVYGWDGASMVGNPVLIEDFFNEGNYGAWQPVDIPLSAMGLTGLSVTAFRFEVVNRVGGKPVFWLDSIQLEEPGGSALFQAGSKAGCEWRILRVRVVMMGPRATRLVGHDPNALHAAPAAVNGIVIQVIRDGAPDPDASGVARTVGELGVGGFVRQPDVGDDVNTLVSYDLDLRDSPYIISGDVADNHYQAVVNNDDLSANTLMAIVAMGQKRPLPT